MTKLDQAKAIFVENGGEKEKTIAAIMKALKVTRGNASIYYKKANDAGIVGNKSAAVKKTVERMVDEVVTETKKTSARKVAPKKEMLSRDRLAVIDPEDREHLKGKSEGHVIGWNKVKYKQTFNEPVKPAKEKEE